MSISCEEKMHVNRRPILRHINLTGVVSTRIKRLIKQLLLLTLPILCLCSCTTKILYNYLDTALLWELGHYVNLSSKQKKHSKSALKDFHQWHRNTQLRQYSNYLRAVRSRIHEGDITAQELEIEHQKIQVLIDRSINQLIDVSLPVLMSFNEKQIKDIEKSLKKDQLKYYKKYIKPGDKKRTTIRLKELKKFITNLIGRLNESQQSAIDQWSTRVKPYEHIFYKQQEQWNSELATALKQESSTATLKHEITRIILYSENQWPKPAQAVMRHNREQFYTLMAKIINHANSKQKQKLLKRLEAYAKDFDDLSGIKSDKS